MKTSRIWEILKNFKERCRFRGWRTAESEDWVEINSRYHNFLLAKNLHPSSFKSIVSNKKCVVREGASYRVVEAAYTAWLFSETSPENFVNIVLEDENLSKRVAIYDLTSLFEGKTCFKINQTDSLVFQEFENFLEKEFKVKLMHYPKLKSEVEGSAVLEVM
jgi:hypothetical protein